MVPRENKKKAYAKFGGTNKEYYGIFRTGLWMVYERDIFSAKNGSCKGKRSCLPPTFLKQTRLSSSDAEQCSTIR